MVSSRGNLGQIEVDAPVLGDEVAGLRKNRQVDEPEEVHLQQTKRRHRVHGVLGSGRDRAAAVGLLRTLERHYFVKRLLRYDDSSRVRAGMAGYSFETFSRLDQLTNGLIGLDCLS